MDDSRRNPESAASLPRARVTRWRWGAAAVWTVPLVAAVIAGYLIYDRVKEYGPAVTIRFQDGSGIRVGQTPVRYRGVQIGEVVSVGLSEDQQRVEVRVRLQRSAASVAREGALFWIVRPEVGVGNITGLSTVISGPEIQALPGSGEERLEFTGLERAPAALEVKGLKITLRAGRLGSLQRNSPVYYHGVEVGVVQNATLSRDATAVQIDVLIRERYARLVRGNTVFWNVSGASVSGGLFRGVELRLESLRSLAAGGINFATPDGAAPPAREGAMFPLHAAGRPEWLAWMPRIPLPDESGETSPPEAGISGGGARTGGAATSRGKTARPRAMRPPGTHP